MPHPLRDRAMKVLLDDLDAARYPSVSLLQRIEDHVTDRKTAERYVGILLDRLSQDRYPSPTMLDRVLGLVASLERPVPANRE